MRIQSMAFRFCGTAGIISVIGISLIAGGTLQASSSITATATATPSATITATASATYDVHEIYETLTAQADSQPTVIPLVSNTYLNDTSLITAKSASGLNCNAPCYQDVIVGKTSFSDAIAKIKANSLFNGVQSQAASGGNPASATWNTAAGVACCQMAADDKGLVNAILIKFAPQITAAQVIKKFGTPQYVSGTDYSSTEVAIALIFPDSGLIVWISPGDSKSTLQPDNPVVVVTFLNPATFSDLLKTATLQGWSGYRSYSFYQTATPITTPAITFTPNGN